VDTAEEFDEEVGKAEEIGEGDQLPDMEEDQGELLRQHSSSNVEGSPPGRIEVTYKREKRSSPSRRQLEEEKRAKRAWKAKIRKQEKEKKRARALKKAAREKEKAKQRRGRDSRRGGDDRRSSRKKRRNSPDALRYYKDFRKKPEIFRKLYSSSPMLYSSSASESSSSDDFPSPTTPRSSRDQEKMFKKMRDLQRRLYESEIENRKLRAHRRKRN